MGILQIDDLRGMTTALFSHLDKDGTGEIGCSEFIQAFTSHDAIKVEDVAHFFSKHGHDNKKVSSVLRGWLDDSHQQREGSVNGGRLGVRSSPAPLLPPTQEDQEQAKAESECHDSLVSSGSQTSDGASGDAGSNKYGISEPHHQTVPGIGISELQLADAKQPEVTTPRYSMKWLEQEILTMRENTPREGLSAVWEQAKQQQAAASTYGSSNRELDYLGLLSALQVALADIERRLEKLEIKDMEGQITGWNHRRLETRDVHRQLTPRCYLQVLSGSRESAAVTRALPAVPATCSHSMVLRTCTFGDRPAKQEPESSSAIIQAPESNPLVLRSDAIMSVGCKRA